MLSRVMWKLGEYEVAPTTFSLEREGVAVALQRRPFDVLLCLVAQRDRVVSRDELLDTVWKGVAVSAGAVSTAVHEVRAALGDLDRPRAARWIETVRGRGFRYRGPFELVESTSHPTERVPFVGRRDPMERIKQRFTRAEGGQGGMLLIEGAAGMGKTRLLLEIEKALPRWRFVTTHCEPDAPPLYPMLRAVRILHELEAGAVDAGLDELERLLGEASSSSSHAARVDAVSDLLRRRSRERPIAIVLEDLHWADHATLSLVEALALRLDPMRVLMVVSERTGDDPQNARHGLGSSPSCERLRLEPLSVRHLYPLCEAIIGRVPPPESIGRIEQASGGVPLIALELIEGLAAGEEDWGDVSGLARRVFATRFAALSAESRDAVGIAALCGFAFDAPLVEAAAGTTLPSDRAWIQEATRAGVVVGVAGHPLRFRFRHALLREAAEAMLDPADRSAWHGRIALALEQQHPEPTGRALSQLARHSAEAVVATGDLERPLRYGLLAARRAASVSDWSAVELHAGHALDWLEYAPPGPVRDRQEVDAVLLRCASIAWATGHVEETQALLDRIAPALARLDDARAWSTAEGFSFANARVSGRHARARESLARIVGVPELAEVAECWSVALAVLEGEFEKVSRAADWVATEQTSEAVLAYGRATGRDPGLDRLGLSAFAIWANGEDARAVAQAERAVAWAESSGDQRGRIWALFLLCMLHEFRHDWSALERWAPEIDQESRKSGVLSWLGLGTGLGLWARAQGAEDRTAPTGLLAGIILERARSTSTSMSSLLFLFSARAAAWCGELEDAAGAAREGIEFCQRGEEKFALAELYRCLAGIRLAEDERVAAAELLDRGIEVAVGQGHRVSEIRSRIDRLSHGLSEDEAGDLERLRHLERHGSAAFGPSETRRLRMLRD